MKGIKKEKDTKELLDALEKCEEFGKFYEENVEYFADKPLFEELCLLQERSGLKKTEIIKAANISDIYGYQIFEGLRKPDRKKLLCLLIAMRTPFADAQRVLKSSGYSPLYPKIPADCAVIYGLCNKLSVSQINALLFERDLEML